MGIKDVLPPIVVRILQSLFLFKVQWKGNYKSYDEAASYCKGYEDSELLEIILEKTRNFKQNIFSGKKIVADNSFIQTIIGLCLSANDRSINIIDFGGGFGYHYFIAKAILKERYNIKWCVVETPAMVNKAESFASEELFFFSDLQAAKTKLGRVDIVFSSSALQYLPEPYKMLKLMAEIGAGYLFLTRVPLLEENKEMYAIQYSKYSANGPGPMPEGMKDGIAKYPINFLSKNKVEEIIEEKYEIQIVMDDSSEIYNFKYKPVKVYGFLAKISER